jgi:hypothetical protein
MTSPGIDSCSLVPLYVEPWFGDHQLGVATAFLWVRPSGVLALVTNWHVVSGRNHETGACMNKMGAIPDHLRVHIPYTDRARLPLIVRVPVIDADGERLWTEHPRQGAEVDIAAIPVDLPPPGEIAIMPMNVHRGLPLKQRIGMPVFILGYPFGRMGIGMPVWKQATFASEPYLAGRDHRYIIVDTASRPGMSGSPVIQRQHGEIELEGGDHGRIQNGDGAFRFVGIYSGRFHTNDQSDAQLGRVWPEQLLIELITSMPA